MLGRRQAARFLDAGGGVSQGSPHLGGEGHAGNDARGEGAGQRAELAGLERVPAGHGVGSQCLGPANPSPYERLKRYGRLTCKRGREQQAKAELELQTATLQYAFAQDVSWTSARRWMLVPSRTGLAHGQWRRTGGGATGGLSRAVQLDRSGGGWPSRPCWSMPTSSRGQPAKR